MTLTTETSNFQKTSLRSVLILVTVLAIGICFHGQHFFELKESFRSIWIDNDEPPFPVVVIDHEDDFNENWYSRNETGQASYLRSLNLSADDPRKLQSTVRRETKPVETGLVVRILTPEGGGKWREPVANIQRVYDIAFGASNSARKQFHDCSGGQMEFRQYGSGVVNAQVSRHISSYNRRDLRNEAYSVVCKRFGKPENCNVRLDLGIDHIMFVAPAGVSDDHPYGYLFAAVGGEHSMYGDSSEYNVPGFSVEGILHELAHNWGVGHAVDTSGISGGDIYRQDNSNALGGSFYLFPSNSNGDLRCYNAFNNQILGWHKDKFVVVPVGESRMIEIGSVSQYSQLNARQSLFVQYGNFYISYNLQFGFTGRLKEYVDRLLVVEAEDKDYAATTARAALGVGQSYQSGNFRVEVCGDNWETGSAVQTLYIVVGENARCSDDSISAAPGQCSDSCSNDGRFRFCLVNEGEQLNVCATQENIELYRSRHPESYCGQCDDTTPCKFCSGGGIEFCLKSGVAELDRCVAFHHIDELKAAYPESSCGACTNPTPLTRCADGGFQFCIINEDAQLDRCVGFGAVDKLMGMFPASSLETCSNPSELCPNNGIRYCLRNAGAESDRCIPFGAVDEIKAGFPQSSVGKCRNPSALCEDGRVRFCLLYNGVPRDYCVGLGNIDDFIAKYPGSTVGLC